MKQKIGKDKEIGKVVGESRIITFRDNNFNIDSKSRFADIVPQIDLDAEQFITALKDAIQKAYDKQKNKKSIEESAKEQEVERQEKIKENVESILEEAVDSERNEELKAEFVAKFKEVDQDVKLKVKAFLDDNNISLKDVSNVSTKLFEQALDLLK
ncbi:hypothetical protein D7X33_38475 [Butyricicoccus sp. 1XD8-22]|nr:hypothetical protein D7X33_38475 [Butyricicoccus sp. 1XD8-22]